MELGEQAADAWFIGDSLKDLQAAQTFGCTPILVKTGNGTTTLNTLQSGAPGVDNPLAIAVYADLAAAATALLSS